MFVAVQFDEVSGWSIPVAVYTSREAAEKAILAGFQAGAGPNETVTLEDAMAYWQIVECNVDSGMCLERNEEAHWKNNKY